MERKKSFEEKVKITGWHYFASFLGMMFVGFSIYWGETEKRNHSRDAIECDQKLQEKDAKYIQLYDSSRVWYKIVKKVRKGNETTSIPAKKVGH